MTSQVPADPADPVAGEQSYERTCGPVHNWFGLSCTNYLVLHRARLQSMPVEWQRRLVEVLAEFTAAYADAPAPDFQVTTVASQLVNELTPAELALLRITVEYPDGAGRGDPVFSDELDNDLHGLCRVTVQIPDPVPHYRNAYLQPDERAIAALRAARQTAAAAGPPSS